MITTFPIFSLRSTFGIESLWKFDLRPFLREIKEILAKKLLFLKTGAVNKDIKHKIKFIRQPSSSDNLQSSNNILRLFDVLDTVKSVVRNADI